MKAHAGSKVNVEVKSKLVRSMSSKYAKTYGVINKLELRQAGRSEPTLTTELRVVLKVWVK